MGVKTGKKDYNRLRKAAEGLFVNQGLGNEQIAEITGVSTVSISRWRREDDWDARRDFVRLTPMYLREKLLQEAKKVADGGSSTMQADTIVKLLAAADRLVAKITPEVIYSVLSECCEYAASTDPEFATQMAQRHRDFLQYKFDKLS